jgi:SAM-dependent methyltransferase
MKNTIAERIYARSGRAVSFPEGWTVYNLGAGHQKFPGVIGVDSLPRADVVWNLDDHPWPIADSSADACVSFHCFEHVADLIGVMEEAHRILKPGAHLLFEVPYFRHPGAFQDPTHRRFFTGESATYFCGNEAKGRSGSPYSDVAFRLIGRWYGWPTPSRNPIARWFKNFINARPKLYDGWLSKIFPAKIVVFELEPVK